MSLKEHQKDWETLGELDPLWAVLSDKDKRFGKWDPVEFFATGEAEIDTFVEGLASIDRKAGGKALDFGCGVGRLSFGLARHYDQVTGVDISEPMIAQAKRFTGERSNCEFVVNLADDLSQFASDNFDLVFTKLVLQHVPSTQIIEGYIQEFLRILKPGGLLVFQLPHGLSRRARINPRRHLYKGMRLIGFSPRFLMDTLKLSPIHMSCIPRERIEILLKDDGAKLLKVEDSGDAGHSSISYTYFVTK